MLQFYAHKPPVWRAPVRGAPRRATATPCTRHAADAPPSRVPPVGVPVHTPEPVELACAAASAARDTADGVAYATYHIRTVPCAADPTSHLLLSDAVVLAYSIPPFFGSTLLCVLLHGGASLVRLAHAGNVTELLYGTRRMHEFAAYATPLEIVLLQHAHNAADHDVFLTPLGMRRFTATHALSAQTREFINVKCWTSIAAQPTWLMTPVRERLPFALHNDTLPSHVAVHDEDDEKETHASQAAETGALPQAAARHAETAVETHVSAEAVALRDEGDDARVWSVDDAVRWLRATACRCARSRITSATGAHTVHKQHRWVRLSARAWLRLFGDRTADDVLRLVARAEAGTQARVRVVRAARLSGSGAAAAMAVVFRCVYKRQLASVADMPLEAPHSQLQLCVDACDLTVAQTQHHTGAQPNCCRHDCLCVGVLPRGAAPVLHRALAGVLWHRERHETSVLRHPNCTPACAWQRLRRDTRAVDADAETHSVAESSAVAHENDTAADATTAAAAVLAGMYACAAPTAAVSSPPSASRDAHAIATTACAAQAFAAAAAVARCPAVAAAVAPGVATCFAATVLGRASATPAWAHRNTTSGEFTEAGGTAPAAACVEQRARVASLAHTAGDACVGDTPSVAAGAVLPIFAPPAAPAATSCHASTSVTDVRDACDVTTPAAPRVAANATPECAAVPPLVREDAVSRPHGTARAWNAYTARHLRVWGRDYHDVRAYASDRSVCKQRLIEHFLEWRVPMPYDATEIAQHTADVVTRWCAKRGRNATRSDASTTVSNDSLCTAFDRARGGESSSKRSTCERTDESMASAPDTPVAKRARTRRATASSTPAQSGRDASPHTRCVVCASAPRNVVFVACKHFACCAACATALTASARPCPVCNTAIDPHFMLTGVSL